MLHVPADIPVTSPVALTVAIAGLLLLQAPVPPPRTNPFGMRIVVPPMHNRVFPKIEVIPAFGLIVTGWRADTVPPQPPVIV